MVGYSIQLQHKVTRRPWEEMQFLGVPCLDGAHGSCLINAILDEASIPKSDTIGMFELALVRNGPHDAEKQSCTTWPCCQAVVRVRAGLPLDWLFWHFISTFHVLGLSYFSVGECLTFKTGTKLIFKMTYLFGSDVLQSFSVGVRLFYVKGWGS